MYLRGREHLPSMYDPGFESLHWEEGKESEEKGREGQGRGGESQRAEAGIRTCACNLRTQEMEARRSGIQGHLCLHSETEVNLSRE